MLRNGHRARHGMFRTDRHEISATAKSKYPHHRRKLNVRDLPPGRAAFLGAFEDGVNTYWLLVDSGEVWMVRGYADDEDQRYGLVNSSIAGLQNVLAVWEAFACSGKSDADDDYEDYVEDMSERARQCDQRVFEDEDSWWSRVFEEVELGVLVPEEV
ncbi:SUKH-4 family immunity protein [Streptomyces roseus]|uniref:SUKH-4 family immunity protein n=1 Tax=Streptomyces roseus TaxID=66430 RepID=UPI0037FBD9E4